MQIVWENYDLAKTKELAAKFGSAVVLEMQSNINKLSLVEKGNLLRSIKASVRTKEGYVDRIQFSYEWYGRIFENGAQNVFGKGVNLQPKPWRNPAIASELDDLNKDFALYYASLIAESIELEDVKLEM
jgi:hypothetical protein